MSARPENQAPEVLTRLGYLPPSERNWRTRAACRTANPELFFPQVGAPDELAQTAAAKRVCAACPVREVCLADAMAWEDPARRVGVFGGLAADERGELFEIRREEVA
jgi:WhiB family redox-sensing transcriptional regulator